eukprot:6909154-Alexandrium_andersonii.AAC.1
MDRGERPATGTAAAHGCGTVAGDVTGMGPSLAMLNLTERQLYDVQGNSFHPTAVAVRAVDPLE